MQAQGHVHLEHFKVHIGLGVSNFQGRKINHDAASQLTQYRKDISCLTHEMSDATKGGLCFLANEGI